MVARVAAWWRISVFLPVNDTNEVVAAQKFIQWLRQAVGGYTSSIVHLPVFEGSWYSDERGAWVTDSISILFTDLKNNKSGAVDFASICQTRAALEYINAGSKQDVVYVTMAEMEPAE